MKKSSNFIKKYTNFSILLLMFVLVSSNTVYAEVNLNDEIENISHHINNADNNMDMLRDNVKKKKSSQDVNDINYSIKGHNRLLTKKSDGWFHGVNKTISISIPDTNNKSVWLSRDKSHSITKSFTVGIPNDGELINAEITLDGIIVYKSSNNITNVAVQSFEDSARIITVLNEPSSSTEYEYPINVPTGGKIYKNDNGGIAVVDATGNIMGGFTPPWAIDNEGKQIDTYYDIRGNTVIQVINHVNPDTVYPVVADPWLFIDLISSSYWTTTAPYGQTLRVTPTTWARTLAFSNTPSNPLNSYFVGIAGWNELYTKQTGLNVNYNGLRNQFICHQQIVAVIAPTKPTWNIDKWRTDVGYTATVNAQCNPGLPGNGNIID